MKLIQTEKNEVDGISGEVTGTYIEVRGGTIFSAGEGVTVEISVGDTVILKKSVPAGKRFEGRIDISGFVRDTE